MYTWGYIKEATLIKLDMSQTAAIQMGLMNKFPYYANEALTQICSIKPRWTSTWFKVRHREKLLRELTEKYDRPFFNEKTDRIEYQLRKGLVADGELDFSFLDATKCKLADLNELQTEFLNTYKQYTLSGTIVKMPRDFISFGIQPTVVVRPDGCTENAYDTDYQVRDYNTVIFFNEGEYNISYNARWFTFSPGTDDDELLDMPSDVVDCIPMYIASQCLKIDDEQKAMIMRNEFELALARLDTTHYVQSGTFKIGGGW